MRNDLMATGIYGDGTRLRPSATTAGFDSGPLRVLSEGTACPKVGTIVRVELVSGDWRLMVPIEPTEVTRGAFFHADITVTWEDSLVGAVGLVGDARPWLRRMDRWGR